VIAVLPLALALAVHGQQPVEVQASLSAPTIEVGETVTLRIDVVTDGARAQIQPITTLPPGMEVAGTRDWDQRQFSLPGGVRRHISREFVLRVRDPGRYQVPALTVIVDGRTYASQPMLLEVLPGSGAGRSPLADEDVILRAWTDADTVFVGQQVTLHVEALFSTAARLRLRRAPEYEPPAPSGFWVHDIPDPRGARPGRGDVYESQTFRRALFPVSAGRFEIPPARLFYEVRRGILQAPEVFTVETAPIPVTVLPVPQEGRPVGFTGAVGRFDIVARIQPERVAAGDAAILIVEVTGAGNIKALPPPRVPDMPGLQIFPPRERSEERIEAGLLQGTKRFEWVVIPQEAGRIELPALEYAFFDPQTHTFGTAGAAPLALAVDAADRIGQAGDTAGIRYLRTEPSPHRLSWVASPAFLAAQVLPFLLFAGALIARRRQGGAERASPRSLRSRRRDLVADLERRIEADDPQFFRVAATESRAWVAERIGVDGEPSEADLKGAGVSADVAESLGTLWRDLDAARFAPDPPASAERREWVQRLGRLLEAVDRTARRPRSGSGPVRTGALALLLLVVLAAPVASAAAVAVEESPFAAGVRLYDDGRFRDAVMAFRSHLDARPDDAAGWYNLGTAAHRAGMRGQAVHAWLRSVHLDPRDRDGRHNLRVLGTPPEVVRRAAPVPLRTTELALLAALAWLIGGVAGAVWILRGRKGAGAAAASGVAIAVVLAGTALHSTRGADTVIMLEPAQLRAGPSLNAEALATVEPGSALLPVDARGDWLRTRTLQGREGWVEAIHTARIRNP
jgi:hypothetical protein